MSADERQLLLLLADLMSDKLHCPNWGCCADQGKHLCPRCQVIKLLAKLSQPKP